MKNLRLIDAHSHINFAAYKDDGEEVIRRAAAQGIGMLAVGTQQDTSAAAVAAAEKYENVWAVIGLHPVHLFPGRVDEEETAFASRAESFDAAQYRQLAQRSKKVVAIGECGLDYFHVPDGVTEEQFKSHQAAMLRQQLDLALELRLPVMIHCRDAHADLAAILEGYAAKGTPLAGDIHCFTGTIAEADRYLALGFYLSFTGIVTFPPRKAEKERGETLADVVRHVPLDRMLVETDAPYLAPVPHRGEKNEPAYVQHVAEFVAQCKGLPAEEVATATLENTLRLFRIPS